MLGRVNIINQLTESRYNRQGHNAKERRSRDNHINRGNTRTKKARNTGTYNQPLQLTESWVILAVPPEAVPPEAVPPEAVPRDPEDGWS